VCPALADGAKVLSSEQAILTKQLNDKGYAYDRLKSTVEEERRQESGVRRDE